MEKRAVFFDFDNTLCEYDSSHEKAMKAAYKVFRKYVKVSFEEFIRLYDVSKTEVHRELTGTASSHNRILYFQRMVEKLRKNVDSEMILRLDDAYWGRFFKSMRLYDGVIPLLKELKRRGIKIGIVTDFTADIQLRRIHALKVGSYIDVLVTSEEAGRDKPHPAAFLFALNKLGILPHEAIVVGDNPEKDIEGANAVGIDTVLLMKGVHAEVPEEDYRKPKFVINELPELLGVLEKA